MHQIHEYFREYNESSTIFEITEGYINDNENIHVYIRDALTYNAFLDDDEKKYDLYILQVKNNQLISTFYREEFGDEIDVIRAFNAIKND